MVHAAARGRLPSTMYVLKQRYYAYFHHASFALIEGGILSCDHMGNLWMGSATTLAGEGWSTIATPVPQIADSVLCVRPYDASTALCLTWDDQLTSLNRIDIKGKVLGRWRLPGKSSVVHWDERFLLRSGKVHLLTDRYLVSFKLVPYVQSSEDSPLLTAESRHLRAEIEAAGSGPVWDIYQQLHNEPLTPAQIRRLCPGADANGALREKESFINEDGSLQVVNRLGDSHKMEVSLWRPIWSPASHASFPRDMRERVRALFLLSRRLDCFPPRDVLGVIAGYTTV